MASSDLKKDLQKPLVIVGMGVSGRAILRLLLASGLKRDEILTHDPKEPCDLPSVQEVVAVQPKTLIVSPGVPLKSPWIQRLRESGAKISSELEISYRFLSSEKLVGITGSVGKSTVTSLIGAGLKEARIPSFVGGNLGFPLADYVTDKIESGRQAEWIVLELSSYQLENFPSLSAQASVIVSLTPNHLERYENLNDYYETKLSLVHRTHGPVIFNLNGLDLRQFRDRFSSTNHLWISPEKAHQQGRNFANRRLVGDHNHDNIALASALGDALGWPPSYQQGLLDFTGLPHRLENLGEHRDVLFLNDSKATTIASVQQAVLSVSSLIAKRNRTWLLLGGKDKNLPWEELSPLSHHSKLHFYFFGEVGRKAQEQSRLPGAQKATLREALEDLFPQLLPNDLVLLSPGGTSWDEFKSFEDRGVFFKTQIEKWSNAQNPLAKPD